jgi:hypothetical protein
MNAIRAIPLPDVNLIAAYTIFIASSFAFALGKFPGLKIDRPGSAIIGAVAMVAFRIVPPGEAGRPHRLTGLLPRRLPITFLTILFGLAWLATVR